MIIQVRGTSGSGKSHLVRLVMATFPSRFPVRDNELPTGKKRKHPVGYYMINPPHSPLFVPGHYESPCGGVDTINWARTKPKEMKDPNTGELFTAPGITGWEFANQSVIERSKEHCNVIYEGLMVGYDKKFILLFKEQGIPVKVIGLNTPFKECVVNVKKRREARGDFSKFYPHNSRQRIKPFNRAMDQLESQGVDVHRVSVDEAFNLCAEWLNLPHSNIKKAQRNLEKFS